MRVVLVVAAILALAAPARAQVLDARRMLAPHAAFLDNRDWDWYARSVPLFESPEPEIDATYYYRWELVTKHLTYGDPSTGYTLTEFIDRPFWSGAYGAISCPLGHQLAELRWLKDRRIVEDFARYWFEAPGAQPRSYSNWYGDAVWGAYLVLGDRAFLRALLPYMKRQYDGWRAERWDAAHGLFHWDGLHDGMERNVNSRQTDDIDEGADGYRPTLNSYLFADARAIARASALFGDSAAARLFDARADSLRRRVQAELWDPRREFFLHQAVRDEPGGVRKGTRTYETGKYAGDAHGRELIGYVPWQFHLPDSGRGYERAWRLLMDSTGFAAPFGPTTTERADPQFLVSPRCCWWSGNSWPFATTQTLAALANLLLDYPPQPYATRADWLSLLRTYTRTQRKGRRPYVAEAASPFDGSWEGHDTYTHSEHYFHSAYVDLIVTGLVGLRPRADDSVEVNPLAPEEWPYFALDDVAYHGRRLSILWDRDGTRYGRGRGLTVLADGRAIASAPRLARLVAPLGPPRLAASLARRVNLAVNNGRGAYPWVRATHSAPSTPTAALVDGGYRYTVSPPDRWTDSGSTRARESLVLDFGAVRPVEELTLYLLDDGEGSPIRAPASYDVEIWRDGRWVRAPERERVPAVPEGHRANHVRLAPGVRTARVRVTLAHRPGAWVGLSELEAWTRAAGPVSPATTAPANLAYAPPGAAYPRVSASFAGEGTPAAEAVDMRVAFTRYSRNRWSTIGSPDASDWLAVDFGAPRAVRRVELYLWGDDRAVRAPRSIAVQYWDGARWADARIESRSPERPATWAVNVVRIAPVRASRVRVRFEHDAPAATAVTELMVWGDDP